MNPISFPPLVSVMPCAWYLTCLVGFALCALSDLRTRRIPNKVTYPLLTAAIVVAVLSRQLPEALLGGLVAGGLFLLPRMLAGPSSAGMGDVKLALLGGLVCGLPLTMAALIVAFGAALLILSPLLLCGRLHLRQAVPFGPYLALGFAPILWQLALHNIW